MRTTYFSTFFLFFTILAQAQEDFLLYINTEPTTIRPSRELLMMLDYKSDTILYEGVKYVVNPPELSNPEEAAFGFIDFTGNTGLDVPSGALVILDGYNGYSANLYVDKNFNLNLNDDGEPFILKDSLDKVTVVLTNTDVPGTNYEVDLQFIRFKNEKQREMIGMMIADNFPHLKGNTFIDHNYWLTQTKKRYLIFDALLKEDSVKLALVDDNINGLYNDIGEDKILVGDYQNDTISDNPGKGNYTIGDATLIEIENKYYQLLEVEPTGKYIKLRSSSKQEFEHHNKGILSKGVVIPDLSFKKFDGQLTTIHQELANDKYNLIDFWGTWCKGCIEQTDQLKRLHSLHEDSLNIIGLNYDSDLEKAKAYVAEHGINWNQGIADEEMIDQLLVNGFPFYILVDKEKKIHSLGIKLNQVENLMSEK